MKTITLPLATFTCALALSSASAKTLVWYHFDEVGDDESFAGHELVNAANPGTLNGVVYSVASATYTANDDQSYATHGTYAFKEPLAVYDPVSGQVIANKHAIMTGYYRQQRETLSGYCGGAIRFKNEETPKWGTFTMEAFILLPPYMETYITGNKTAKNYGQTIFGIGAGYENWVWSLQSYRGNFWLRTTKPESKNFATSENMCDNKWHHVAVTVDNSSGTTTVLTLFVDYKQINSLTINASSLNYGAANATPFTIGADPGYGSTGKFFGVLDEFRVSDTVLTTDQFLRMKKTSEGGDDVLCWWSMENWATTGYEDFTNLGMYSGPFDRGNTVAGWTMAESYIGGWSGSPHGRYDATEFVQETIYADRTERPASVIDAGSFLTVTNETMSAAAWGQAASLKVTQKTVGELTSDDFTLEFFMKTRGENLMGGNATVMMIPTSGSTLSVPTPALQFYLTSAGILNTAFTTTDGKTQYHSVSATRADDGTWHHVAVVYEKSAAKLSFYFDRRLRKVYESATLSDCLQEFVLGLKGTMWNNNTGFAGWLDELRITRRALPQKKLMSLIKAQGMIIFVR